MMRLWLLSLLLLVLGCGGAGDQGSGTESGSSGYGNGPTRWGSGEGGGTPEGGDGNSGGEFGGETGPEEGGESPEGGSDETYLGYPSAELGVVILGPTAEDSVSLQNGTIQVSGILFDEATSIYVSCSCGDVSATVGTFWSSPPLSLLQGDNYIEVTATNAAGDTATDSVMVTYTPLFEFDGAPAARPSSLWVNEASTLYFSIPISTYPNFDANTVTLVQVDPVGNALAEWAMADDGDFMGTSGDEVPADGKFTTRLTVTHPTAETLRFRVRVQVETAEGGTYLAWSATGNVDALNRLSIGDCQAARNSIAGAQSSYNQAAAGVGPGAGQEAALVLLGNDPLVLASGASSDGYGAWAYYSSGVFGVVYGNVPGTRGAPSSGLESESVPLTGGLRILSRWAHLLSPYASEFPGTDETDVIGSTLEGIDCPPFDVVKSTHGNANVAAFSGVSGAGVISIVTHGLLAFGTLDQSLKAKKRWEHEGSQVVLGSGEAIVCESLETVITPCSSTDQSPCGSAGTCVYTAVDGIISNGYCMDETQVDLLMGRLAMGGDGNYAILPSHFRHHARHSPFPESLVYVGSCFSLWNGSLAGELYAAGAKAIAGFTGTVSSAFANNRGSEFFTNMIGQVQEVGTALVPLEDPDYPGTWFRLIGATNLDLNDASIINADFETADTTGWTISGDGRVVAQLASTNTVSGKFMGILSTGLGYTQEVGELSQRFCIPPDRTIFRFWWKFYSEEFIEWCGSSYQDAFEVSLESEGQSITATSSQVDDLCPPGECLGCGAGYESLDESDVAFDQGDVWNTEWRQAVVDISALSGTNKPVLLRFITTDVGDSIYDTVILIDSLVFE